MAHKERHLPAHGHLPSCLAVSNVTLACAKASLLACRLVEKLRPFPGMQHLDVAGGTGDVAFRVLEAMRRAEYSQHAGAQQPVQPVGGQFKGNRGGKGMYVWRAGGGLGRARP